MSLANVSTARLVLDAQRLDTRTTYAPRNINVLTVEKTCIIQQKVQEL